MRVTMKNIILLILLELCITNIFCYENILSKFHQKVYKIRDLRIQTISYSKKYFNIFEVKSFKYNRTTPAVNSTVNMKVTVKDQVEVLVQGYKLLSNEFRHFPIRFQVNLKEAVDSNAMGMKAIKNCGNTTTFSFEKDITYYACNFVMDETRLPPLIPNGIYRHDMKLLYLNEEIAYVCSFGEVYTPIAYPKN